MNYTQIESLVQSSRQGNHTSKELLAEAFKPFILNISKRTFINGYDFYDVQSECYKILFNCVSLYKPETNKFVAYATSGIKKSLNDLIKKSKNRSHAEGHEALILCGYLEHLLPSEIPTTEEMLCEKADYEIVTSALSKLPSKEKELITYVFLENNTVRAYAAFHNINYSTAIFIKNNALKILFDEIKILNE
ncbi:putative ECF RNA polymerase sigma factor [Clostridium neonatale]|uniref:sigma-70 family RNA polymerase sigma factor n=1 Tax=Clostridium neonatale TaxID=137838 RepID=UPI00291C082D|nr:sigma-70 family RNA polymerase sigma factor [Clostridium neonatale]CAI3677366.1 putative ECF RNA polymerase sigma factor [Clostridium neonatale]